VTLTRAFAAVALLPVVVATAQAQSPPPDPGGGWRSVLGTVAAGDPAAVSPDYQEGVARLRAGDTAAGVERLRAAFTQNPTSAAVAEELGVGLTTLGARHEAESHLRKAIALDGRRSNAYVSLADLLSGSPDRWQRQAELAAFFAQGLTALTAVADEGRGRQALGIAVAGFEASVGQLADARRRLQTLLGEALPAALRQRAQARLAAIEEEERARSLADWPEPALPPADAAALAAAERALDGATAGQGGGEAQAALAAVTPLVQRHPGSSRARFLRARALNALERWDEEVRELALVLQLRPSHARAWRMLGQTLALRGGVIEAERADEALRRALALEPSWDDLRELRQKVARKRQGAGDTPPAPAPPPPTDKARRLLDDAQRWIGVDAAEVAAVSLREALADSPAYVEAAAALYGLTGEVPEATVQALWQHGPSLARLSEALLRVGGTGEGKDKATDRVRPWLDRAAALGAPEARFVRALLLVEEGNTSAALTELAAYAASDVTPARLGEALALRGSLQTTPEAGAPEARARTLLLAGRADQAARLLGGACRPGAGVPSLLELGRIEEHEGRPSRALDCYRMALAAAGAGNQAGAAAGRRAALERIALLGGYAPAEALPGFAAELERAAQAGVVGADWALARLHTHAERWSEALARATAFLARAPADDPLRPRAEASLVDLRRRDHDVRWWRQLWSWGAVAAAGLVLLALVLRALQRRRAWDVATAIERAPDVFPEVAAVVAEVRHDVLKHRASALGLLDDPSAGAPSREHIREEIRRLLVEPVPASVAVTPA
jgi:predicted Zn-dependent protease